MTEFMPRYWHMLRCIPHHPGRITTEEIARKLASEGFDVTRRTIERDLRKLSEHFAIEADESDKPFGWFWCPGVKGLDLPGMSMSQAVTFALAEAHLTQLLPTTMLGQLEPFFQQARERLNNLNAVSASKWPHKVRVIQATQPLLPPTIDEAVQSEVYTALFRDQKLRINYLKKGADRTKPHVVNPLGLVQRGQVIYLLCSYENANTPLTLAIHRIKSAEALANKASAPDGFDFDQSIQNGLLQFQRHEITEFEAIFDKNAAHHLFDTPLSMDQQINEVDDQHVRVTASIADTEQLKWWILGFGVKVEVLKPISLRHRIVEIVNGLNVIYAPPSG